MDYPSRIVLLINETVNEYEVRRESERFGDELEERVSLFAPNGEDPSYELHPEFRKFMGFVYFDSIESGNEYLSLRRKDWSDSLPVPDTHPLLLMYESLRPSLDREVMQVIDDYVSSVIGSGFNDFVPKFKDFRTYLADVEFETYLERFEIDVDGARDRIVRERLGKYPPDLRSKLLGVFLTAELRRNLDRVRVRITPLRKDAVLHRISLEGKRREVEGLIGRGIEVGRAQNPRNRLRSF